jgi:hypothetical protein
MKLQSAEMKLQSAEMKLQSAEMKLQSAEMQLHFLAMQLHFLAMQLHFLAMKLHCMEMKKHSAIFFFITTNIPAHLFWGRACGKVKNQDLPILMRSTQTQRIAKNSNENS